MRMDDRKDVRSHFVHGDMHGNLTGAIASALDFVPSQVADDEVVGLHLSLADSSRSAQDVAVIQPDTHVPVVHSHPTLLVDQAANPNEVRAIFLLSLAHGFSQILPA